MATLATLAKTLRQLHVPGKPLILTNIYDAASARAVATLAGTQALATTSFAVAAAAGTSDDRMTLETNLAAVQSIAPVAKEYGLPLTVDFQDGYGDRLEEGICKLLELGVAGINLEDCHNETKKMFPIEEATERVKRVMAVAKEHGVPDFVVNARADSMIRGGLLSEVITRGKLYLAAGATVVFVLGGSDGGSLSEGEVKQLTSAFNGRLNAPLRIARDSRTVREWSELGVGRLSIGPQLQIISMKKLSDEARGLLNYN